MKVRRLIALAAKLDEALSRNEPPKRKMVGQTDALVAAVGTGVTGYGLAKNPLRVGAGIGKIVRPWMRR